MNKYVGETEKMFKAIFKLATMCQPAVIFIDEIDSLLRSRSDNEADYTRRLKTEFLVAFDGVNSNKENKWVFVMGATNRPQDLDSAVLRRFHKRILVDLPGQNDRKAIIKNNLNKIKHSITGKDLIALAKKLDGFSGSDIVSICKQAAYVPIREASKMPNWMTMDQSQLPALSKQHFLDEIKRNTPSCPKKEVQLLKKWGN